jgi:hypothetical protein
MEKLLILFFYISTFVLSLSLPPKPGVDCARMPREAMFVALRRKVDTILPRAAERTLP